jgi:hypothetical protein
MWLNKKLIFNKPKIMFEIRGRSSGATREYILKPDTILSPDPNEFTRDEDTLDPTDQEWWQEAMDEAAIEISQIQEEAAQKAKQEETLTEQTSSREEPEMIILHDAEIGEIPVAKGFGEMTVCIGHETETGKPIYIIQKV